MNLGAEKRVEGEEERRRGRVRRTWWNRIIKMRKGQKWEQGKRHYYLVEKLFQEWQMLKQLWSIRKVNHATSGRATTGLTEDWHLFFCSYRCNPAGLITSAIAENLLQFPSLSLTLTKISSSNPSSPISSHYPSLQHQSYPLGSHQMSRPGKQIHRKFLTRKYSVRMLS